MARDIAKQKLRKHESYLRNKETVKERARRRRRERKKWYIEFMADKFCTICTENESACLDWHHLDPNIKEGNIGYMVRTSFPLKKCLEEMSKCIVVCANCHRKIHAGIITLEGRDSNPHGTH